MESLEFGPEERGRKIRISRWIFQFSENGKKKEWKTHTRDFCFASLFGNRLAEHVRLHQVRGDGIQDPVEDEERTEGFSFDFVSSTTRPIGGEWKCKVFLVSDAGFHPSTVGQELREHRLELWVRGFQIWSRGDTKKVKIQKKN